MVNAYILGLFILSLTMTTVMGQTFQYSRGWRNGKRSTSTMMEELVNSNNRNAGQLNNVLINCELQKLRLLLQGNINNQMLPCELLVLPKRSVPDQPMINDHFHRQVAPSNNNY